MRRITPIFAITLALLVVPIVLVDVGTAVASPIGQPPFPTIASPAGLAGGVPSTNAEPSPPYVPQTSCDPSEKPGITAFKTLVLAQYPSTTDWGSSRNCSDDGISEHLEGRAWDWNADSQVPDSFMAAANVLAWLTANDGHEAKRLGIMYIGYNHRIWGAYRPAEGWRPLKSSNPHTDHVHFSFTWNGAMKNTSFWTGNVAPTDFGPCRPYAGQPAPIRTGPNSNACPTPAALPSQWNGATVLWLGSVGPLVTAVQTRLAVSPATGTFGPVTQATVSSFQRSSGLPVTGSVDAQTWFALGMGTPGPADATVRPTGRAKLTLGMSGPAVQKLQRALGFKAKKVTGYFGVKTQKSLKRWQATHGMKPNGIANARVRSALHI